jgi:hypothetical protein
MLFGQGSCSDFHSWPEFTGWFAKSVLLIPENINIGAETSLNKIFTE